MSEIPGAIKGQIVDEYKQPIPFASVSVTTNGVGAGIATTDLEGEFSIKYLAPGVYDLQASCKGYQSAQRLNIQVPEGKTVDIGALVLQKV